MKLRDVTADWYFVAHATSLKLSGRFDRLEDCRNAMTLEPTRITLARQQAVLSKPALARLLGACERTVSNYESVSAPNAAAADLARALGCSPKFLHRPAAYRIETERVFFRAPRRTSTARKVAATALARSGVDLYDLITNAFHLPASEVPELTGHSPQDAAAALRVEWDLGLGALPDMLHLLESRGVRVLSLPANLSEVGSFSFWEDGSAYIFLNAASDAQQRFDLAHELGHLLMHSALAQEPGAVSLAEREADDFAARLLLPALSMQVRVSDSLQIPQLLVLQELFGVPARLILAHAHGCGLLRENTYRWLCQELALEPAPEAGQLVSRVFSMVFPSLRREHRRSTVQIADELGLTAAQLHELTFGQAFIVVAGGNTPDLVQAPHVDLRAL